MFRWSACLLALSAAPAMASPAGAWFDGQSNGTHVVWSPQDLSVAYQGRTVYSAHQRFAARSPGGAPCWAEGKYRLLSMVGPVVSYEYQYGSFCGQAHPAGERRFATLDARTGKSTSLLTWFPERDVFAALVGDSVVKRALNGKRPAGLGGLFQELDGYMGPHGFTITPACLEAFAFHHLEGNRVAVRVDLLPADEASRNEVTELGLLLPIPRALAPALAAAATGHGGVLMGHAPQFATSFVDGHPRFRIIERF